MRTTEVAIVTLNLQVELHAGTTQELKAFDSSQSEAVQCQQCEAHLQDDVLHGEVGCEEDDVLGTALANLNWVRSRGLLCSSVS